DNDREGEAIAFHIRNAIMKKYPKIKIARIVFNEITPQAIKTAISDPLEIDVHKVEAQKARRVLDRLVGYKLSPILWKKVKNGLSAGRVQSVALRLICERGKEVDEFIPTEYWTIEANFKKGKKHFEAQLVEWMGKKPEIPDFKDAEKIVGKLKNSTFNVASIKEKQKVTKPLPPFTTSKLQQAAANRFGFTSRKTMQVAQTLYEGVEIDSERIGLITYMRTDSTRVAQSALDEVRNFIQKNYPKELPVQTQIYSSGKSSQDAHEAIRPTYVNKTPDVLKKQLSKDQFKIYSIIWERFVSSQMTPSLTVTTSIEIKGGEGLFRVSFSRLVEKGFQQVLKFLSSEEKTKIMPSLKEGEEVECDDIHSSQHFTKGPAYYNDASIIKMLEENGIGRPSTYAPIISVILDRYYVVRKDKKLIPTVLGKIIVDMLKKTFPTVVDVDFTAQMESRLDHVEDANENWVTMIKEFYGPFDSQVTHVMENLESIKGVLDEPTSEVCEKCGRPMVKKLGRYGFFIACTGFPECINSKPVPLADCPVPGCDGKIIAKRKQGARSKPFYGCTRYPDCTFISYFPPTDLKCPKCGYFLVEKSDKKRGDYKACINPDCDYLHLHEEAEAVNA
ncbi:MAG: type I DNA topoisomerase, partial [Spirochaetales bacterium]|nr:type I DNA topoisomerase [Spirochaetales bacterium]